METERLKEAYAGEAERAGRLRKALAEQLETLLATKHVSLGVPLESRVKDWASIEEKIRRKSLSLSAITELPDLIGVRLIVLFKSDQVTVDDILRSQFDVMRIEDTAARLSEVQFGYHRCTTFYD